MKKNVQSIIKIKQKKNYALGGILNSQIQSILHLSNNIFLSIYVIVGLYFVINLIHFIVVIRPRFWPFLSVKLLENRPSPENREEKVDNNFFYTLTRILPNFAF